MAAAKKKAPKRGHRLPYGEGSFSWSESQQMWIGTLDVGTTTTGKRDRIYVRARDEDRAWDKLQSRRKALLLKGKAAAKQRTITVKDWLTKWLEIQSHVLRPATYSGTHSYTRQWIVPTLGGRKLEDLTPADIRGLSRSIIAAGRSTTTAGTIQGVFQKALRDAILDGYQVPDAVLLVPKPAKASDSGRSEIPLPQAVRLIHEALRQPDGAGWVAALLNGLRQGERLGLTWDRVDFEAGTLDISWQLQQLRYLDRTTETFRIPDGYETRRLVGGFHLVRPKSAAGERVIPMVPWLSVALKEWKKVCPEHPDGLIFPRDEVWPRNAKDDLAAWKDLQERAGVWKCPATDDVPATHYVLHEARHTTATLLLSVGVDPEIIKAIMGHSKIVTTQGYQHVSRDMMLTALKKAATALTLPQIEG